LSKIVVYTDGACSGNPGPGGWGAVIIFPDGTVQEMSGGEEHTTNQRMEMKAAIKALSTLEPSSKVELYSDSAYLVNAFLQGWLEKWKKNGWLTAKKKDVDNRDLWEELVTLEEKLNITWKKVKGHSNDYYNDKCDKLAREAIPKGASSTEASSSETSF